MASIVSFKAGRLQRRENTDWVDPSPVKGTLQLLVADDGLLHFQWLNRASDTVEDDLIIFPSEATFEKVAQSAGGRTFVLKFTSSNQRHFYWLQDASTERDSQIVNNVNQLLADPTYAPNWEDSSPEDNQPQASTSTGGTAQQPTAQQLAEIRNILSQMGSSPVAPQSSADLSLADVLTPANLAPLFASPELVRSIFPHLPPDIPEEPSVEVLQRVIDSQQFQSAVRSLDQALATGLLGGLVRGLGLPEEAGTGVAAFLSAIKAQAEREGASDTMETD
ncbi:adhesion regulating molecule [Hysterangium stoloniferum]|nr:adhesion regulating molecule [Hysterangium stoloniferum]